MPGFWCIRGILLKKKFCGVNSQQIHEFSLGKKEVIVMHVSAHIHAEFVLYNIFAKDVG